MTTAYKTLSDRLTPIEMTNVNKCLTYCQDVCSTLGDEFANVVKASRRQCYVDTRMILMTVAVEGFGLDKTTAGVLFRRDRTTVTHAVNVCKDFLTMDSGGAFFDSVYQVAKERFEFHTSKELKTLEAWRTKRKSA